MSTPEESQSWPWWRRTACFTRHICQGLLWRSKNSTKHNWVSCSFFQQSAYREKWVDTNIQDTHHGAGISWNFNPLFLCRRSPTSNPSSGQVEVSSALATWSGFFSKCCYSSGWFRSAVLVNADIQQSLNALRASNRFEGWPEAARWMNCPKNFFFFNRINQCVTL